MDANGGGHLRNPFVCPCCNEFYSTTITSDNAPSHLGSCGHTMCVGCVKRYRKVDEMTTGSDNVYTLKCSVCDADNNSKPQPRMATLLIEIISEIQSKIPQMYYADVNVEVKEQELNSLKCPGCNTMYSTDSTTADRLPHVLSCGQAMCVNCLVENSKEEKNVSRSGHNYNFVIKCFKCAVETIHNHIHIRAASIEDTIKWLKKKREEQIQSNPRNMFMCSDCGEKTHYDRGFRCSTCTKKDSGTERMLCGYCTTDKHKRHTSVKLLPIKLRAMKEDAILNTQSKIVKCNVNANEILDEYRVLLKNIEEHFSAAIDTIPLATKCSDGIAVGTSLKRKAEEYEGTLEKFITKARKDKKPLEDILNKLNESFPDLIESDEESERNEETEDGERAPKRRRVEDAEGNNGNGEETEV